MIDMAAPGFNPDSAAVFGSLFRKSLEDVVAAKERQGTFTHTSLEPGQIRLMVIIPDIEGANTDDINCILLPVRSSALPPYECLSYCWGEPETDAKTIFCNGLPLRVSTQLLTALWCLRTAMKSPRVLWVDQICINQDDLEEKSAQVARMAEIFTRAERVLLFPGVDELQVHAILFIFDFCNSCAGTYWDEGLTAFKRAWLSRSSNDLYQLAKIPRPNDAEWVAVRALLSSSCFKRTWIIQELALAKEVRLVLVDDEVKFDLENKSGFGSFVTMLHDRCVKLGNDYVGESLDVVRAMFTVRSTRLLVPDSSMLKLGNLLSVTRDFGFTDPRDKIYGLISIASDAEHLRILPDYTQSVQSVFTITARKIMTESKSLQLLLYCQTLQLDDSLPAWVPDWRTHRLEQFPYPISASGSSSSRVSFKATLELPLSIRDVGDDFKLGLQGILVDIITTITSDPIDITDNDFYDENIYGHGTWWSRAYAAVGPVYEHTGETLSRALGRTRIADDEEPHLRDDRWSPYNVDEDEVLHLRKWPTTATQFHLVAPKIMQRTLFRSFFTTSKKYMGLAPLTAREGDQVMLLPGADVPYVLRHVDGLEYSVVGQCYAHGIMFGEAADSASLQDIVLV
ncbi:heterokaryon incompatibility protein-domain-containing protein [Nemania sp. FL0916]|nr:heterokaryon incompatibility protein-domain-containing protein [Nemania sp. FL0916]